MHAIKLISRFFSLRDWVSARSVCREWKSILSQVTILGNILGPDFIPPNKIYDKLKNGEIHNWHSLLNVEREHQISSTKFGRAGKIYSSVDCGTFHPIKFGIFSNRSILLRKKQYKMKVVQWEEDQVKAVKISVTGWETNQRVSMEFLREEQSTQSLRLPNDFPLKISIMLIPATKTHKVPVYALSKHIAAYHSIHVSTNEGIIEKRFQVLFDDSVEDLTTSFLFKNCPETKSDELLIQRLGKIYMCRKNETVIKRLIARSNYFGSNCDLNQYVGLMTGDWRNTFVCAIENADIAAKHWNVPGLTSISNRSRLLPDTGYMVICFL